MPGGQLGPVLRYMTTAVDSDGQLATDKELLERYAAFRDREAFATLVQRHGRLVRSVCRHVLHHEAEVDDAFQVTFLVFACRAGSIRKGDSVASWLHGVAYRCAMNAKRARSRRGTVLKNSEGRVEDRPVTAAALRETQAIVDDEVSRLPEKYRAPFVLCCLEGKSREEAARQLNWKVGTVSSRLAQARKELQQRLTRRGVVLSVALCLAEVSRQTATAAASPTLIGCTVQAALSFAAGKSGGADLISPSVAALAKEVLQSTLAVRMSFLSGALLCLGLLCGMGLAAHQSLPARNSTESSSPSLGTEAPAQVRTDGHGDPLPPEAVARAGTVRFRFADDAFSLRFSSDGKCLLGAGTHGVHVWDSTSGRELQRVAGEGTADVLTASYSADGRRAATHEPDVRTGAAGNQPVFVWDVATGKKLTVTDSGLYQSALLSPDGTLLATIELGTTRDPSETVRLWDVANGWRLRSWKAPHGEIRHSLFTGDGKTLVTAGTDKVATFWDVATGRKIREISGLASDVFSIAVSTDGTLLGALSHVKAPEKGSQPGWPENRLQVWDVPNWKELWQAALPANRLWGGFRALAFSPDGTTIATPAVGALRVCDARTGKELRRIPVGNLDPLALAFSPNGKRLAAANGVIRVYDLTRCQEIPAPAGLRGAVAAVGLTSDGQGFATRTSDGILLWARDSGKERLRMEDGLGFRLHLANNGRTLFSSGPGQTLLVRDLATGKELRRLSGQQFGLSLLAVSPDGKVLALGQHGEKSVLLADATTGKELRRLEVESSLFALSAFTPDGRKLVVWSRGLDAQIWDVASGTRIGKIPFPQVPGDPAADRQQSYAGDFAALSPDGKLVAFAWSTPVRTIALCELATGKEVRRLAEFPSEFPWDRIGLLTFSTDGRTLAWASHSKSTVRLLEVVSGRERHQLKGHTGRITALAFSPDDKTLVSGSYDSTALVWDLTNKREATRRPLGPGELAGCWRDLAGEDATRAYQAMRRLGAFPKETVAYVRERLLPDPASDAQRLERLLSDLDSDKYARRESAQQELAKLGDSAIAACRRTLERGPSLEARRRLEPLLAKLVREAWDPSPERRRAFRALELAERIGTPEAQELLQFLSKGAPESRLTGEARASLERLSR
jgi:RNA polymerase sigma factor (sigma-70 family)